MDNWSAAASGIPRQLFFEPKFPTPMEEIAFDRLLPGSRYKNDTKSHREDQRCNTGLWAQMIPLTSVICQIDELHTLTVQNNASQGEIYDTVQKIANTLDSWVFRLPATLKYSLENLDRYCLHGQGRTFIALHLGYHHHSQLLYYQFLHQESGPSKAPRSALDSVYTNRCKEHAAGVTRVLWQGYSMGLECIWVVNGHLLAVSSSIHLHTLLFDNDPDEIESARSMLKQNFEMMMAMSRYWPGLDLSMTRLRTFHRQCQTGIETSFAMDQWMLRFLQKYTKPMSDKPTSPSTVSAESCSPNIRAWQAEVLGSRWNT